VEQKDSSHVLTNYMCVPHRIEYPLRFSYSAYWHVLWLM